MVALAASDVTVTVEERTIEGKKRRNRCKIVFGDGALTYPTGGVPLPTYENWGMTRNLDYIILVDPNDDIGYHWKYDLDNHKLQGYYYDYDAGADGAAIELTTGVAPAAGTFYAEAVGW